MKYDVEHRADGDVWGVPGDDRSCGVAAVESAEAMNLAGASQVQTMAFQAAMNAGLPVELVCAVCEQESGWNVWAVRYEPGFYARYISSMKGLGATEMTMRATSFGLMQVMGQTAREFGFDAAYLTELCDPATGLRYGCKKLSREMDKANGSMAAALLGYNGGGDTAYPAQVMARMEKYK